MRTFCLLVALVCLAGPLVDSSQAETRIVESKVRADWQGEEHYRVWAGTKFTYVPKLLFDRLDRGDCLDANWIDVQALGYAKPASVLRPHAYFGVLEAAAPQAAPVPEPLDDEPTPTEELPPPPPKVVEAVASLDDMPSRLLDDVPLEELTPSPLPVDEPLREKKRVQRLVMELLGDYDGLKYQLEFHAVAADGSFCVISAIQMAELQLMQERGEEIWLNGDWLFSA
jgi:hypothetical protein